MEHTAAYESAVVVGATPSEPTSAERIFSVARQEILRLLTKPMKDVQVAAALGVSGPQARAWLQRLVADAELERLNGPIRYAVSSQRSLLSPR